MLVVPPDVYLPPCLAKKKKDHVNPKKSNTNISWNQILIKNTNLIIYIESAIRRFWWGSDEDRRKIHWMRKEKLLKAKIDGGLGFKSIYVWIQPSYMLAKQVWRLHTNPNSLLARVLKAKYYPMCDVLQATVGDNPSYT